MEGIVLKRIIQNSQLFRKSDRVYTEPVTGSRYVSINEADPRWDYGISTDVFEEYCAKATGLLRGITVLREDKPVLWQLAKYLYKWNAISIEDRRALIQAIIHCDADSCRTITHKVASNDRKILRNMLNRYAARFTTRRRPSTRS